jgi:glucose-1-phosphate adenylyltransferase
MQLKVMAFVLAGGKGTRLYPLTKSAQNLPFRSGDVIALSISCSAIWSIRNLFNLRIDPVQKPVALAASQRRVGVLWDPQEPVHHSCSAQMRSGEEELVPGTADAIHQNLNLIEQANPHVVAIFGADHIYRMNIRQMIEYHEHRRADATVAAIPSTKDFRQSSA